MTSLWFILSDCRLYHMTDAGGESQFSFCVNLQINVIIT